jgi:hypothetical protein
MQDALRIALLVIFLCVVQTAYFLALRVFFPGRVARTRALAELMPGRAFAVGLVNFLFFGAIVFVLLVLSDNIVNELVRSLISLPVILLLILLGIGLSFGLAAMAELAGERLAPAQSAFRRTLWGTLTLVLGSALPLAGWFLLLPYAGLTGLGAFILAMFWREPATLESSPAPRA